MWKINKARFARNVVTRDFFSSLAPKFKPNFWVPKNCSEVFLPQFSFHPYPFFFENHFAKKSGKLNLYGCRTKATTKGDVGRLSSEDEEELEKISEINNFDRSTRRKRGKSA